VGWGLPLPQALRPSHPCHCLPCTLSLLPLPATAFPVCCAVPVCTTRRQGTAGHTPDACHPLTPVHNLHPAFPHAPHCSSPHPLLHSMLQHTSITAHNENAGESETDAAGGGCQPQCSSSSSQLQPVRPLWRPLWPGAIRPRHAITCTHTAERYVQSGVARTAAVLAAAHPTPTARAHPALPAHRCACLPVRPALPRPPAAYQHDGHGDAVAVRAQGATAGREEAATQASPGTN